MKRVSPRFRARCGARCPASGAMPRAPVARSRRPARPNATTAPTRPALTTHEDRREHPLCAIGDGAQEARKFQPLAGDGQDEEREPPGHDVVHGRARRPQQVADGPARCDPATSVNVNSAVWRRKMSIGCREQHDASGGNKKPCCGRRSRPRSWRRRRPGRGAGRDTPSNGRSQPPARARSRRRRNAQIISGPCSAAAAAASAGTLQPSRARPAPPRRRSQDEQRRALQRAADPGLGRRPRGARCASVGSDGATRAAAGHAGSRPGL